MTDTSSLTKIRALLGSRGWSVTGESIGAAAPGAVVGLVATAGPARVDELLYPLQAGNTLEELAVTRSDDRVTMSWYSDAPGELLLDNGSATPLRADAPATLDVSALNQAEHLTVLAPASCTGFVLELRTGTLHRLTLEPQLTPLHTAWPDPGAVFEATAQDGELCADVAAFTLPGLAEPARVALLGRLGETCSRGEYIRLALAGDRPRHEHAAIAYYRSIAQLPQLLRIATLAAEDLHDSIPQLHDDETAATYIEDLTTFLANAATEREALGCIATIVLWAKGPGHAATLCDALRVLDDAASEALIAAPVPSPEHPVILERSAQLDPELSWWCAPAPSRRARLGRLT